MEEQREKNPGRKMTINDVAEALSVSASTVSRAISGKGRIGEATRKRVFEFMIIIQTVLRKVLHNPEQIISRSLFRM